MIFLEEQLTELARRHLPPAVAEEWIALIRPAIHLRHRTDGEPTLGRLGGLPSLPGDVPWPSWEGRWSLNFVASLDCGRLPVASLDLDLPAEGTLLFFYLDNEDGRSFDDEGSELPVPEVAGEDQGSLAETRVLYLPPGVETAERPAPGDIVPYPRVELGARLIATGPDFSHPEFQEAARRVGASERAFMDDYRSAEPIYNAVTDVMPWPMHWLGGHARPVQDAVELDAAYTAFAGRVGFDDPRLAEEASRWRPLAQFDSDEAAGMQWGDVGTIYWLMRPGDLAARRFEAAAFTVQYC
ncbi:DUF1963 domain-containing protein [Actinomadura harenae]|uniref:DUF1963 domain-containing protein n=1 Tax=Actinomadura harenae TaxID=2483351 RepID=A0A3M2LVS8_9ACTN|nr:YwqG family protein [Actinomadura harenae]RMI41591.1 DUF1963 domain-containing protein [Actinomadura harenae]